MKKLIVVLVTTLITATAAIADSRWHGGYDGHHDRGRYSHDSYRGNQWVAPLVLGSVIGYALTRPTYVEPAPIVYAPPPHQTCNRVITQDQFGNTIRDEIRCY